jgi:hypothetical protein
MQISSTPGRRGVALMRPGADQLTLELRQAAKRFRYAR